MAVKMRLRRMGKKKSPFYRVVVADSRAPRDGRYIEVIGTYNPLSNPFQVDLKEDRVYYWLGNGAQPTDTVKNLFQKKGLWLKWDLMRNGADEAKINEEYAKWQAIQAEREARIAAEKASKENTKKAEEAKAAAEAQAAIEADAAAEKEKAEKAAAKEAAKKVEAEKAAAQEAQAEPVEVQTEETTAEAETAVEETPIDEATQENQEETAEK